MCSNYTESRSQYPRGVARACSTHSRRAPTLFRRFGSAGEVAVDLLARLLAFDSAHRCSCEEALAHEYFEDLVRTDSPDIGHMDPVVQQTVTAAAVAANREEWMVDDDQHGELLQAFHSTAP